MKKRGNSRGGEALGVAKPVSPPHTPPLRARRCATPWRMLIYRLSPVYCCIGGVRLSRFFVPPDGKAARAAGLFPGIWQKRRVLLSVHHTPIDTIPTQPIPWNTESFPTHCSIPQRRTATCPERGSARGKNGLRNSECLSPSQTCPRPSVPLKGKEPHCPSVPLKSNYPSEDTDTGPPPRSVRQTHDIVQYLVQLSHYFYQ